MFKHLCLLLTGLFAVTACNAAADKGAASPAAASAPASTVATPARQWELGSDYLLIDPRVPTTTGDKIEVVEVFSYACPHCAHFQPFMDELKSKLPATAQIVLIPAVFNPAWEPFARAFYAAKATGILDSTHQALFDALHRDHLPLGTLDALANGFYAQHGANAASFLATANSFIVDSQLARGNQLVHDYGVTGTPTLIVNGKYRVEFNSERNIGPKELIEITLYLVKQEAGTDQGRQGEVVALKIRGHRGVLRACRLPRTHRRLVQVPKSAAQTGSTKPRPAASQLKLLSCNILAGGSVRRYRHYVPESWKQVLPGRSKRGNLDKLAALLADFDIVGLQESDAGSLRSGFLNQTEYLAEAAEFPYWSHQPNRKIAQFAASSNGLLTRLKPVEVRDYPLPSRIPGRGALWSRFIVDGAELIVVIAHLSLGPQARKRQLDFIADLIGHHPRAVLMGDLNCALDSPELAGLMRSTGLTPTHTAPPPTFPSWRPRRAIDHILVSEKMEIEKLWTLPHAASDHLPLAAHVRMLGSVRVGVAP